MPFRRESALSEPNVFALSKTMLLRFFSTYILVGTETMLLRFLSTYIHVGTKKSSAWLLFLLAESSIRTTY